MKSVMFGKVETVPASGRPVKGAVGQGVELLGEGPSQTTVRRGHMRLNNVCSDQKQIPRHSINSLGFISFIGYLWGPSPPPEGGGNFLYDPLVGYTQGSKVPG